MKNHTQKRIERKITTGFFSQLPNLKKKKNHKKSLLFWWADQPSSGTGGGDARPKGN